MSEPVQDHNRENIPESFGIAISGGGVRASLYALGALSYLVHSELNSRVRIISSVSGGSIVNGSIAMWSDFSQSTPDKFDVMVGKLASHIAKKGVFFFAWRRFLAAVGILFLYSPLAQLINFVLAGFDASYLAFGDWRLMLKLDLIYAVPMILYFLIYIALGRRSAQTGVYSKFPHAIAKGTDNPIKKRAKPQLSDFIESGVRHVLCATELTSGQPIYMDKYSIYSTIYGVGSPKMKVASAIYASAAFPLVFPPQVLKTHSLDMSGGQEDSVPARLWLSDGGVFNNLGTDSFTAWRDFEVSPFMPDQRFPPLPQVACQLIINASSPGRAASMPRMWIIRNFVTAARVMSILYENTLRPRIERLRDYEFDQKKGAVVIDISDSPVAIAERVRGNSAADADNQTRATILIKKLDDFRDDRHWQQITTRAATTKTVLRAIGKTDAARLVRLGYLNATVACHVRFGTAGLETVPSEQWFRKLVEMQSN